MSLRDYCESALASVEHRGIANDGPVNVGGLSRYVDNKNVTETVTRNANVTPQSNADRQRAYRARKLA